MRTRPAGFTLIELIVAIVVSSVVLGAAYRMLTGNQRFYRAQSQIVDVQQNIRAVAQILPSEFRELAASGGDIEAMSDTGVTIKAMRGFGVTCAPAVAANGYVILRNSLLFGYRGIDVTRDRVFVFRDGDRQRSSDDSWLEADISAVTTTAILCTDGSAGTRLTLINMVGGLSQLDSVHLGAPLRTWERVQYGLWRDASGQWWLATSSQVSGAFTAPTPVAGPLRDTDGIRFTYRDAAGAVTPDPADVVVIDITVRGRSNQPIQVAGRPTGRYEDSTTVRVALRNN